VRTASDFLMALQLTGAAKTDSVANMQLRLPVVVVGGGLTGDRHRHGRRSPTIPCRSRNSCALRGARRAEGAGAVEARVDRREREIAAEFLAHARAIRAERGGAAREPRARIVELLQQWGGATIAYRRRLIDSPSTR
jgi:NADPH-dependent glutamate synthase beta subunit-like oxidoreductase